MKTQLAKGIHIDMNSIIYRFLLWNCIDIHYLIIFCMVLFVKDHFFKPLMR